MLKANISDIEYIVSFLSMTDFKPNKSDGLGKKFQNISINHFNNAQPLTLLDSEFNQKRRFFMDVYPKVLRKSVDTCLLDRDNTNYPKDNERHLAIIKVKQVFPKDVRGFVNKIYPFMFEVTNVWIDSFSMTGTTARGIFGWTVKLNEVGDLVNSKTVCISNNTIYKGSLEDINTYILSANGLALTMEYEWSVSLGFYEGVKIKVATDYEGIKDVFRLRDIPNGEKRKRAIIHWVNEHCRRKRNSLDNIKIDAYLRGQYDFKWNGLHCIVNPALDDVLKLKNKERQLEFIEGGSVFEKNQNQDYS